MKLIFAYNCWSNYAKQYHENIVKMGENISFDIVPFCLTPNAPKQRYCWNDLNHFWSRRYYPLVRVLKDLKKIADDADILWIYNGANFHPDWIKRLPENLLTVYGCFDDPESSYTLSAPVAPYFDACLVGNIASIPQYHSWGCYNVEWGPMFIDDIPIDISHDDLSSRNRPIDLIFLGERVSPWRQERLDYLYKKFPDALFLGKGWPKGEVDRSCVIEIYQSAKLGINIHNSTGPVNKRTFDLPANGVMQICDNKCRLGQIFTLDNEVVGFDNIKEAVELIHYYLEHENERERIAWNGYVRLKKDYSPEKLWIKYEKVLTNWKKQKESGDLRKPPTYKHPQFLSNSVYKKVIQKSQNCCWSVINELFISKNPPPTYYHYLQTAIEKSNNIPYFENKEYGPCNYSDKIKRIECGGFFEWPNIVALNWTVASLVGTSKEIVELGSGTGCFAYEVTSDPSRFVLCSELDEGAREWAKKHRNRPNIQYINYIPTKENGKFDLVVAIDVIEHIYDFKKFLITCTDLAPKAIITTPNKSRNNDSLICNPPAYNQHIREWTAGEFYWILRNHYDSVELYSMPNAYIPLVIPIKITDTMTPLIAICENNN